MVGQALWRAPAVHARTHRRCLCRYTDWMAGAVPAPGTVSASTSTQGQK
ncbi:hypothetical protein CBM2587_B80066 [Cupriavidus taiwanensis]|uniref:Uncharacterized protein n=1 Tax=Cupriavidus taiwanensis TaxID=164546 RepID=A0A976A7Z7_9BURK|nr:hypothetical protein CBM2587_B80066 [Cupriavidus taiwanensis]